MATKAVALGAIVTDHPVEVQVLHRAFCELEDDGVISVDTAVRLRALGFDPDVVHDAYERCELVVLDDGDEEEDGEEKSSEETARVSDKVIPFPFFWSNFWV